MNDKIKLSALKTARQIEREGVRSAWATLWYHYTGWLPNQIEILWLKYKPKGRWVPIEQAEKDSATPPSTEGPKDHGV